MKRIAALCLLAFGLVSGCHAASPSFSSFNQTYFTTNNLFISIRTNWISTNSITTLIVTNLYVTNLFSDDVLWTNDTSVINPSRIKIKPEFWDFYTETTNTLNRGYAADDFASPTLVIGNNTLSSDLYSAILLLSPTNDPAQCTLQLKAPLFNNQLELLCYTNIAFTGQCRLPNGSSVLGSGGTVRLNNNQNWDGVNGAVIRLRYMSPDWIEVGRWFAGSNNQPTTIIINPTDTYVPVRESAGVFADSGLRAPSAGSSELITVNTLTVGTNVGATFVPFRISAPIGHTNWLAHINSGGTNWLHIDNQGRIGIGRTNVFINKDIGIYRAFDQDGNKPAWINIGAGDSWPFNYASEWWAKTGTNDGVMQLSWLTAGASTAYDHQFTVGSTPGLHRYKTMSNNVTTFQLNGDSGDLAKIKQVDYSWPVANANATLLNDGSGNLSWTGSSITINPTDNYLPVRTSSTTFGNSPLHVPSSGSTNTIVDGQFIFGPGTTNVLSRNANDLVYTNGGNSVNLEVRKGDGASAKLGLSTGSHVLLLGGASSDVYVGVNNNGSGDFVFQNTAFTSTSHGTDGLGSPANSWGNFYLTNSIFWSTTNVLSRSGTSLVYTNGANTNTFTIRNGIGTGHNLGFTGGGGDPRVYSETGFYWIGSAATVFEGNLIPDSGGTRSLGTMASNGAFADSVFSGSHYVIGSNDAGANFTRLRLRHTGNAGDIEYKSDALGTQTFRPHVFQIGSTNVAKFDTTSAAGETRFWLYDEDNGTMERVTVGVADSGGAGYKLLRIPN